MRNNDVIAIIICFHPDHNKLINLISGIDSGVSRIILFNNGGVDSDLIIDISNKIEIVSNGRNAGLGEALNFGCDKAFQEGYRFLISFDQDSNPSSEMINSLRRELLAYQEKDSRAIAIGPQLIDRRDGTANVMPFIQFDGLKTVKWRGDGTQPVSYLITSGCMIDIGFWSAVDRFCDDLFIDFVDNNWSWRAEKKGYILLGTSLATMPHEISEGIEKKRIISVNKYSPFRRYFQMRNAAYHLVYERLTLAQRLYVLRAMAVTFVSSLVSDVSSLKSLWQCLRGLGHGLIRKLGAQKEI